jgi:hypothetical protein
MLRFVSALKACCNYIIKILKEFGCTFVLFRPFFLIRLLFHYHVRGRTTRSVTLRGRRLRVMETELWKIFGYKRRKWSESGEN